MVLLDPFADRETKKTKHVAQGYEMTSKGWCLQAPV